MLKKFLIVCCACLALCPLPKAPAQYARVGVDGPIPLGKLDAMENMLDLADAHQKADLLTRLGVDPAIAKAAAEQLMPGKKIELQPIRAEVEAHYGVAFLPSGTGTECFLYLLLERRISPARLHGASSTSSSSTAGMRRALLKSCRCAVWTWTILSFTA